MKQIEKLQAKARQRFGFCGSLIIHFILFVALAFSGVFAMQPPVADADTVVFFDAGGGGGGGADEAVADAATMARSRWRKSWRKKRLLCLMAR